VKRYRIIPIFDFDFKSNALTLQIKDHWDDEVKAIHLQNRANTELGLKHEFGDRYFEAKIQNFIDLGPKPISIIAFHNKFFEQIRTAFVMGAYYPALTSACALGERILNHLILNLRDEYRSTPEYKTVCRKNSFDNWEVVISTLIAWKILLPNAANNFLTLMRQRHRAIHFRPETDHNVRQQALEAIKTLQEIIGEQFSGFGPQPWFITSIGGEIYIKKQCEAWPFIRKIYLPYGLIVGPHHQVEEIQPQVCIVDPDSESTGPDISDDEFVVLRQAFINSR
jgi:hypothetical protein